MAEKDIARAVQIFGEAGAKWALVGAHATGLFTEPRATADFDFIIEGTKLDDVVAALSAEHGDLDVEDIGAALRLRAIDIDLIRSDNHPLFGMALTHITHVRDWCVPRVEVIIALKFLAATSPWRNSDKRGQDVVDLRSVYRSVGRDGLDMQLGMDLAALVYPTAERELAEMLDRIDRGEKIQI